MLYYENAREEAYRVNGTLLREARRKKKWTQRQAAVALDVTQAYLSMLEKGRRPVSEHLVGKVLKVLSLPPTAVPLGFRESGNAVSPRRRDFAAELGALGYSGFSYLRFSYRRRPRNPAEVLLEALGESDLDSRVAEGLPWLVLRYADMDWNWLTDNAKLRDLQNRLGFAVSLASDAAETKNDFETVAALRSRLAVLEKARLAREDTFCHESMTLAEKAWLRQNRSAKAAHWNLLSDMRVEQLEYANG
jgi:transcriptional regulator with XRE-family HTH domain